MTNSLHAATSAAGRNSSKNAPALPVPKLNEGWGFTKKEYAAIMLRVPTSGVDWLDEMIIESIKIIKTD